MDSAVPGPSLREAQTGLLAAAGLALAVAAPLHRPDLLVIGILVCFAALLWRPLVGPAVIAGSLPFFFFPRPLVGPISVSPPELALVLAWIASIAASLRGGTRKRVALRSPITGYDLPLALFLLAALISLGVTEYLVLSVRELRALILEPVLFFWLLAVLPRRAAHLALMGLLLSVTLVAGVTVVQALTGSGGTEAEGVRRAQAWYPSPNHLALTLGRALPFLAAALIGLTRSARQSGGRRLLTLTIGAWLAAAIVAAGLVLTFSVGAFLGVGAGLLALAACAGKRRLAVSSGAAFVGLFLLVSLLASVGRVPERLNPLRQTTGFRLDLWSSSLEMIRDHPLLGVGLDNFVYQYQQIYLHEGAAAEPNLSHPHNWILHFWVQLGLLGLVAFVWLLVRFWKHARRALHSPATSVVALGAIGSLTDMLVHGLIDNSYFLVDLAFIFWLTLALVMPRPADEEEMSVQTPLTVTLPPS